MIQSIQHETVLPPYRGSVDDAPGPMVRLRVSLPLDVHVETMLGEPDGRRTRHRGLALTGNLHFPELSAEVEFCDLERGDEANGHAAESQMTATIIPRRFTKAVPCQYLQSPVREDSDVWALTHAPAHDPPWLERYVGLLEGDALAFDQHLRVVVTLDASFTLHESRGARGMELEVAGDLCFEQPMNMRLSFRDPEDSTAPPSQSHEAVLVASGSRVPLAPQTLSCLTGPVSLMIVRLIGAGGRVIHTEASRVEPARRAS